ncbi:MAG: hypothetical protein JXA14_09780 [Anaerolineae bacterium]|nr:hypothetical protein [Anaerolineae bacterium]
MTNTGKKLESLRRQLAAAHENLLLIQERKSEHVMRTDIPLDLIKEERWLEQQVPELEQQIADLEAAVVEAQTTGWTKDSISGLARLEQQIANLEQQIADLGATMKVKRRTQAQAENLDARILQTLYDYQQVHLGDPQMNLNELVEISGSGRTDVIQRLYGLREKEWVDYNLMERAESGLVWLTRLGIRVAKDAQRS